MCMLARACVRAGTRASGRVHAYTWHIDLLIEHAKRVRHFVTSFVAPLSVLRFSTLSHKRCDFRKKSY